MNELDGRPNESAEVLQLTLPADAENVLLARQAIDGAVRSLDVDEQVAEDIKLAVTEACSNVVKYAYGDAPGAIVLVLEHSAKSVTITIADEGDWVEPDDSRPLEESGMGIPLMRALARGFELRRDSSGTAVALEFDPSAAQSTTVQVIDD